MRGMARLPVRQPRQGSPAAGAAAAAAGADDPQLPHGADEAALPGGRGLADQLEVHDRELHGGLSPLAPAPHDAASGEPDPAVPALSGGRGLFRLQRRLFARSAALAEGPSGPHRRRSPQLRHVRGSARPRLRVRRRLLLLHLRAARDGRPGAGQDGPDLLWRRSGPRTPFRAAITLFNDTMAEDKRALAGVMRGMASSRHQAGPAGARRLRGAGARLLPLLRPPPRRSAGRRR